MTQHAAAHTVDPADTPAGGDESAWAAAAATVLRKAGRLPADAPDAAVWDRLARHTVEGVTVPPLGTPTRSAALPTAAALAAGPGVAPFLRGSAEPAGAAGGWDVRSLIADPDPISANRAALADLAGGGTSLWVRLGEGGPEPDQLSALLDGVHLDLAPVVLHGAHPDTDLAAARALAGLARERSVTLHRDGYLGADPVGRVADAGFAGDGIARASGTRDSYASTVFRRLPETIAIAREWGIRALVVDGSVAHDAGAGDAGELGYTLATGAAYLRALTDAGLDVDTACELIEFRYAVTDDQFATIAKLRAARLAWHRVAELSGASPASRAQRQHAVTSAAMLTRYDPWVNLLRGTVAAFAAGVGGAAAVTVLPFDSALGVPDEFGRRMARNVSALLLGESHVGAVADPAGGSHAVEMLTAEIAEAAWAEFGRIEAVGGVLAALADGSLASRTAAVRAERDRRIATRRQPITGVSEFPDRASGASSLPHRRPSTEFHRYPRWSQPFEMLRDEPTAGRVQLVTIGTPAAVSARLLFTRNLLAAGGIQVLEPSAGTDPAGSGTVVMLVGTDADNTTGLQTAAAAARSAGAIAVFVAGRPAAVLDSLPDGLIDGAVALGDDVLAFTQTVRAALGGDQE
jgi:methylmalonyl-CoA mutase